MDDYYGLDHDYSNKPGVVSSFILLPDHTPDWMADRTQLWNAVEAVEKRKDAQLSREVLLSLPHELTDNQRSALVSSFVEKNFVTHGMIADVSIHKPEKKGDQRNHHAHVMLTMRELTGDGFGKKVRAWNHRTFLENIRTQWADHQNRYFERLGLDERVDHRSLADQGIDREPEPKLGKFANENLRNGSFENSDRVITHYFKTLDRNQHRAELEYQRGIAILALERLKRSGGDQKAFEADMLARHAEDMASLNAQQASEQAQLVARQDREIKEFKHLAKQRLDKARQESKPSRMRQLYELLTLQRHKAQQQRQKDHQQRKTVEQRAIIDIQKMMREEHLRLREKHHKAANMLRTAHQFERDVLNDRAEFEAILNPPQKHYREQPKMAVNAAMPSLTPHLVPKPPPLHLNIIKRRTRQHLINLGEQERTGKPIQNSPKPKFAKKSDAPKPKLEPVPKPQTQRTPKTEKSKKEEHWLDRNLTEKANSVFEKPKSLENASQPNQNLKPSKSEQTKELTGRSVKGKANQAFEKDKPKQPKHDKQQSKKPRLKRRKLKLEEMSDAERRKRAIAKKKAREKRTREAKKRGIDYSRKR